MIKNVTITLLVSLSAINVFAQFMLVDQVTNGLSASAIVAQDFQYLSSRDCRIADDFEVPTGETWYIDSIQFYGTYSNPAQVPDSAGINITIYTNNSGSIGTQVFSQIIQADLDKNRDGIITAYWETPVSLGAGEYWLAASAVKTYLFDAIQWYWSLNSAGYGSEAYWENPGGGFNLPCTAWSPITSPNCTNAAFPDVSFAIFGCNGTSKPNINFSPEDTMICSGTPVMLEASSDSAGVSFLWSTGATSSSISVSDAGHYSVIAFYPGSMCGMTKGITVLPTPETTLESSSFCPDETKTFFSFCETCTFQWSDGSTQNVFSVNQSGPVAVTITDTVNGCSSVESGFVTKLPRPSIEFSPNPAIGCKGTPMQLTTVEAYQTYAWQGPGVTGSGSNKVVLTNVPGSYRLTVTNSEGCEGADTVDIEFRELPVPIFVVDHTPEWVTTISTVRDYQKYKWSNGKTTATILAPTNGNYSVTVTDSFGCKGSSENFFSVIPAGVNGLEFKAANIFPNPAQDYLNIVLEDKQSEVYDVALYDIKGQRVIHRRLNAGVNTMNLAHLDAGFYMLELRSVSSGVKQTARLVIN